LRAGGSGMNFHLNLIYSGSKLFEKEAIGKKRPEEITNLPKVQASLFAHWDIFGLNLRF
jgi:hypothetical protein